MLSRADVHEPYEKYSYFIGEEHSDCFVRAKHTSFFKEKVKREGMNVLILLSCALARLGALSDFCCTIVTNTYSDSLVLVCTQTITPPQKC